MNHLIRWQQEDFSKRYLRIKGSVRTHYYFSDIIKYYTKMCKLSNDNERIINEIQI